MASNHYFSTTNGLAGPPSAAQGYPLGQVQPPPSISYPTGSVHNPPQMMSPSQSLSFGSLTSYPPTAQPGGYHSNQYIYPSHVELSKKSPAYDQLPSGSKQNHYWMDSQPPPYAETPPPDFHRSGGQINWSSEKQPLTSTYSSGWNQMSAAYPVQTPSWPYSSSHSQEIKMVHPDLLAGKREEVQPCKSAPGQSQYVTSSTHQMAGGHNYQSNTQYIQPNNTQMPMKMPEDLRGSEINISYSHPQPIENHRASVYSSSGQRVQPASDRNHRPLQPQVQTPKSAPPADTAADDDTDTIGLVALIAGLAIAPAAGLVAAGVGSHLASKAQEGRLKKEKEKEVKKQIDLMTPTQKEGFVKHIGGVQSRQMARRSELNLDSRKSKRLKEIEEQELEKEILKYIGQCKATR